MAHTQVPTRSAKVDVTVLGLVGAICQWLAARKTLGILASTSATTRVELDKLDYNSTILQKIC